MSNTPPQSNDPLLQMVVKLLQRAIADDVRNLSENVTDVLEAVIAQRELIERLEARVAQLEEREAERGRQAQANERWAEIRQQF